MQHSLSIKHTQYKGGFTNKSLLISVITMCVCAFVIYTCMYGFRKPYTVGIYNNLFFFGISYKVCLVITQVVGYMCSKFYGIKFISKMLPKKRAIYIIICIGIAWLSLLLFAIVPAPYNILCMFLNGLPLGLVFGLVFGFLEGRKTTELLGAFLVTSFIFGSGIAKSVGKYLLVKLHVAESWMPFVAGAFFILPLIVCVWLLNKVPPPNASDVLLRTKRSPMTAEERKLFIKNFGKALLPIILAYTIFTIVRDFCEDFSNELWIETGYQNDTGIFVKMSTVISLIALVVVASFFILKNNYKAFIRTHYLVVFGVLLSVSSTFLFNMLQLSPVVWMLLATTGLYLAYLPFNCLYFERMIATYKIKGNVGFVMYIADAFGYLGTIAVLLIKEFLTIKYNWVNFFSMLFYSAGVVGIVVMGLSIFLHKKMYKKLCNNNQPL